MDLSSSPRSLYSYTIVRLDGQRRVFSYDYENAGELVAATVSRALRAAADSEALAIIVSSKHRIVPQSFDEDLYERYENFTWHIATPIDLYRRHLVQNGQLQLAAFDQRLRNLHVPILSEIDAIEIEPVDLEEEGDWREKARASLASTVHSEVGLPAPPKHLAPNASGMTSEPGAITAIISYARGTDDARVLDLAQRLRRDGLDCVIDQFIQFPPEGFDVWMEQEVKNRRWVLVVATEDYYRRAEGNEQRGVGLGVIWEYGHIRQELYQSGRYNTRFVPVGFGKEYRKFVPADLQQSTYFDVADEQGYICLLRVLTGQPAIVPQPVGSVRKLPTIESAAPIGILGRSLTNAVVNSVVSSEGYEADIESDREFMGGFPIINTGGRFNISVFPGPHNAGRIPRPELRERLRAAFATYAVKSNVPSSIPFDPNASIEGFRDGVQITTIEPKWKRLEVVRFHNSGAFRLFRVFEEDYGDDAMLKFTERTMWMEYFVERVTLLYLLARNVGRSTGLAFGDPMFVELGVSGLQNRNLIPFELYPSFGAASFATGEHTGTEHELVTHMSTTLGDLNESATQRARQFCSDIFWNFGLVGTEVDRYMTEIQRRLVGQHEII